MRLSKLELGVAGCNFLHKTFSGSMRVRTLSSTYAHALDGFPRAGRPRVSKLLCAELTHTW